MTETLATLWNQVLEVLSQEIPPITFSAWIRDLRPIDVGEGRLLIPSPNATHYDFTTAFVPKMQRTINVLSPTRQWTLEMRLESEIAAMYGLPKSPSGPSPLAAEAAPHSEGVGVADQGQPLGPSSYAVPASQQSWGSAYDASRLDPLMTFDSFIVGSSNRFAHAACEAVAKKGGDRNYNPLFIYGGSGLGKTHLIMAIANYVLTHQPRRRTIYVQCEQIVNEFVSASRNNRYEAFRNKYRSCDLLLIDDIQLLTGKDRTKEEFFNTFNALFVNDRNIVMTCDKPPQSLTAIEERLVTRLSSGLICDIQAPDYEMRLAILMKQAEQAEQYLPDDVCDYIATNVTSSIRELEGAFKTVSAYGMLAGEISLPIAREALKDLISPVANRKVTSQIIADVVARFYDVRPEDLSSGRRNKEIALPRQVAMYLSREVLGHPYEQIGKDFGNRHYSTVMYNCEKVTKEIEAEPAGQLARDIEDIRKRIST